jgi:hypothetical protein
MFAYENVQKSKTNTSKSLKNRNFCITQDFDIKNLLSDVN